MLNLRNKLILIVLVIALGGVASVVISNLHIVREGQRETAETSNRQISTLISRSLILQMTEYKRRMEYVFSSFEKSGKIEIDANLFPDYLWIRINDLQGKPAAEWAETHKLENAGLTKEQLLGFKKSDELTDEVKSQANAANDWLVFNSTTQTLFPTFILGVLLKRADSIDPTHIALAEIHAEKMFVGVQTRTTQNLTLIDAHQNVLFNSSPSWDPTSFVLNNSKLENLIAEIKPGENKFLVADEKGNNPEATSLFKYKQGGGLSLVLQEALSAYRASETRIQQRSILIAILVMVITLNLIILFAHQIVSPLAQLTKMMEKAGKGEFTGKIKVRSRDEIGQLATMFNKMLTDLRNREEEIEGAKTKLIQSEKMSAFGQMSAGIAHEVKNPLAGILGYAQMSKKKLPPDSEVLPFIDIIERETVRCKEIVENLMKFARQEKAAMARIDLNKTVKDSIRLVEHQISISGIKLVQVYANDSASIWMKGNSNQIQQVLMNLMLNAQQAMENKGTLTVSTHFESQSGKALIIIADTGCGMPADVKHRIFEPFYTTKGVGKGTGLGLSVSLGIIKDHNGNIDVESEVGKGTTFTISLPTETSVEGDSIDGSGTSSTPASNTAAA